MKEKIYTIPINEAMEKMGECPLCIIEKNLDESAVEYFLGAAMMESDVRTVTNEKGFCHGHFEKMLGKKNVLSLALVLQSRLAHVQKGVEGLAPSQKNKLFAGKQKACFYNKLSSLHGSCAACDRVLGQMNACTQNMAYMIRHDEDFKNKFFSSKGVCIKHFATLLPALEREGVSAETMQKVIKLEIKNLSRLSDEIDYFIKKFDYRNQNEPWNGTEDSPERCCGKLSGSV